MIRVRFSYWNAFVACLVFAFSSVASAETIPAELSGYSWKAKSHALTCTAALGGCAFQQALNADCLSWTVTNPSFSFVSAVGIENPALTTNAYRCNVLYSGTATYTDQTVTRGVQAYSCPANQQWTLDGSNCTRPDCGAGFDRNANGQCVKDCTAKSGQPTVNSKYSFDGAISEWAVGGCKVRCRVRVLASQGGDGSECRFTGASASPNQPEAEALTPDPTKLPPETPADCTSQGLGYIATSTGVRCVASGDAPEGQKPVSIEDDKTSESGTPGTDGKPDPNSPDYEKKETTTENKNGITTEKTTTTKNGTSDGNGGTTCPDGFTLIAGTTQCSKTTSTSTGTKDYCTENPTAKTCMGTEENDECLKNPDRVACKETGAPGETPPIERRERGTGVITPVDLAKINSCPQGMLLPKGLGYYDYQPMCDFASGLKPVILAIAWLSAFFIVLGFSQGDD